MLKGQNSAVESNVYATFDMSVQMTHRVLVRECGGSRSSKMFTINAHTLRCSEIMQQIIEYDKVYLAERFKSDLILMTDNVRNKTHSVTVMPIVKTEFNSETTVYFKYPHYSCYEVAIALQSFLCHGRVTIK